MKSAFLFALLLSISMPLLAQEEPDSSLVNEDDADYVDTTYVATEYTVSDSSSTYDSSYNSYVKPGETNASGKYMQERAGEKKFDEKKWKEIVGTVDYEEEKEKEQEPKDRPKPRDFSFLKIDPNVLRIISFIVVFCLFAFILYYVAQNTRFRNNQKLKSMKPADVAGHVENIEELESDDLLKQALDTGDLRMAVRINYLLLLKKLNEAGLISWKKDKTNRDYLSELYGRNDCYDNVRGLTLAYELVWYGERSVSNESFQRLSVEFETVNRKITQSKPGA